MRHVSRSAVLPKAIVSCVALALTLAACGPEEGDDAAPAPEKSDASEKSPSGGGKNPGDDRRNWVPGNQATEMEEFDFEAKADGKSVNYSVVVDGVKKGKKTSDGKIPWQVYASVTYNSGDGSLLPLTAAGFTLYSDKKTPEKWSDDESVPEVKECLEEINGLEDAKDWEGPTGTQICVPFLLPADKNPEHTTDAGKSYHVGYFKPNVTPQQIAVVWNTDDDTSHVKEPS